MNLTINGQQRSIDALAEGSTVAALVSALGMQAERVALEQNGQIIARAEWPDSALQEGDRLEIVHFVGGGLR